MKKILLTTTAVTLLSAGLMAQSKKIKGQAFEQQTAKEAHSHEAPANIIRCGSGIPDPKWDAAFNILVEQYKQNLSTGKATAATYTIPVIIHVIHNAEVKGGATSYNISQAQVNSQITVLNQDYGGTNADISQCPAAFTSLKAGNTGITFCMVTKDPNGNTLAEPGIDRIDRNTKGWTAPPYTQSYIDGTIKPASIWDPTKYFNIWSCNLGGGLLGYATFPAGSGLSGLSGTGTATTDGVVLLGSALGNTGYQSIAAYNKGRSGTHETGHWLGLRHIWGDGNCLTDYCNDTPPAEASHFNCISPGTPYHVNMCGAGTSPNGEMTMNYMDYTDDACMFMFTADQNTRFQTCMANGTYRKLLTTNSTTECGLSSSTPVAAFTFPSQICDGTPAQFTDASTGPPTSWLWAVSPSTGVTITTTTSQNPTITFTNAGTYSVTLTATNSNGSNSKTQTVTSGTCAAAACDTVSNITAANDTLTVYTVSNGYLCGSATLTTTTTTTYQTKQVGEYYLQTQFPANTKITGAMLLFYKDGVLGTKGTSSVTLNMVNDNAGSPGSTVLTTAAVSLSAVVATPGVQSVPYAGAPGVQYINPIIIPFHASFTTQPIINANFFLTLTTPTNSDTVAMFSDYGGINASNTAFIQLKPSTSSTSTWYSVGTVFGETFSFGLIPTVCPASGIEMNEMEYNVNLFPNPSKGVFNLFFNLNTSSDISITVNNVLGQSVLQKSERGMTQGSVVLDLTHVGKGVYFVNIVDSHNNRSVKKVIVE